jgi:maleate cis-trans isomerase
LKESRERELEALVSREVREAVERNGIELVNYRGLGARGNWNISVAPEPGRREEGYPRP